MRLALLKIWTLELCSKTARHIRLLALAALGLLICSGAVFAQVKGEPKIYTPAPPVVRPVPAMTPPARTRVRPARRSHNESEAPAEKSIVTDAKVNLRLCVSEGIVKINGWERNEIRAFVDGGSEVGFSVRQKNSQGKPNWVTVLGFDPEKNKEPGLDECLSGDVIELDVPRNATIDLTGTETTITVKSVNKVKVKNDGGNIFLNDISQAIDAQTYQGGIVVENSSGVMKLVSTNGNIVAFEAQPAEIGDTFLAKTSSGVITLQGVEHRQVEVSSNSGSIRFNGDFGSGGQYTFGTTNGSISLTLPAEASCKIRASYGGAFHSDLPLTEIEKTPGSPATLTGILGKGDANLNLNTFGGTIRIRKQ